LCNRHGIKQPKITARFDEAYRDFLLLMQEVKCEYQIRVSLDFGTWLSKWPKAKQQAILDSRRTDLVLPSKCKSMVKVECYHDMPKRARLIQFYRNLATQAEYGHEFTSMQKALCAVFCNRRVSDGIDVTMASGMNSHALSDWMNNCLKRGAVCFYERDGKNWDSTMQRMHSEFKCSLWSHVDEDLTDFIEACLDVKAFGVFAEGLLRYKIKATVKSGHNDTSSGNGFINAAIAYQAFKRLGLKCSIIVAGDDLLVAVYSDFDLVKVMEEESSLGIVPVARKFVSPADVSFISGVWLKNAEEYVFVPKIGRLIKRLWWTTNAPGRKTRAAYVRGVARGLLATCGGIPIIRKFLLKFDSKGEALMTNRYWEYRVKPVVWSEDIWVHMAVRYGVSEQDLRDCEAWLDTLPAEPLLLVHPVLDAIMRVDLADCVDRPECYL